MRVKESDKITLNVIPDDAFEALARCLYPAIVAYYDSDTGKRDMIRKRQEQSGIRNMRSYLLKMAIDGRVIIVDSDSVKEMNRLLSNVSNNINQIAKRVNQTGNIYRNDLEEINNRIEEIWVHQKDILNKFNKILDVAYEVKKYKKIGPKYDQ